MTLPPGLPSASAGNAESAQNTSAMARFRKVGHPRITAPEPTPELMSEADMNASRWSYVRDLPLDWTQEERRARRYGFTRRNGAAEIRRSWPRVDRRPSAGARMVSTREITSPRDQSGL